MEKRINVAIAGLILLAPGAWGETAQNLGGPICPTTRSKASPAEVSRRHDVCDARWRRLVASKATGREAYGPFMDRCEQRCAAVLSPAAVAGGALLSAGAVAGLIAASGGEDRPASP